jgi:Secretion system C-terminal sorting domain
MKKYTLIIIALLICSKMMAQLVYNNSQITVQSNTLVHIQGDMTNETGATLTNNGFVNAWVGNTVNRGTVTNRGIIDARSATGLTAGNNEVVILPLTMNSGVSISPTFTLAQNPTAVINGIFSDTAAMISAGIYTQATNTFAPLLNTPVGTKTLYARVRLGSQTYVAPFNFTLTKVISSTYDVGTAADAVLYPNPTTDRLFIKTDNTNQSFFIANNLGQIVLSGKQLPTEGVNLSDFNVGLYHIIIGKKAFLFQKL